MLQNRNLKPKIELMEPKLHRNCGSQGKCFKVFCGKSVLRQIAVRVINLDDGNKTSGI